MCHAQMIGESMRRARKERRCTWCDGAIPAGVVYHAQAMKLDGEFEATAAHERCAAHADAASEITDGECWYGDPREVVLLAAFGNRGKVKALLRAARERLRGLRGKQGAG